MDEVILWPFALPDQFLEKLGYGRAVRALDDPITRARVAELLRRQGVVEPGFSSPGPRRFVALWWESGGDELAWSDGAHSGAGQLEHWSWLEYVRQGMIHGWLVEYEIQLGSSDAPASHALVVDRQSAIAYVAPMALARRIIRAQALGERRWPSEGRAVFGVDEAAAGVLRMRGCWGKPRSSRTRPIQFDVLDDLASGS